MFVVWLCRIRTSRVYDGGEGSASVVKILAVWQWAAQLVTIVSFCDSGHSNRKSCGHLARVFTQRSLYERVRQWTVKWSRHMVWVVGAADLRHMGSCQSLSPSGTEPLVAWAVCQWHGSGMMCPAIPTSLGDSEHKHSIDKGRRLHVC